MFTALLFLFYVCTGLSVWGFLTDVVDKDGDDAPEQLGLLAILAALWPILLPTIGALTICMIVYELATGKEAFPNV